MADKSFGIKQLNLIGTSGTPTIDSPNNLNINAVNVVLSEDLSIGGEISSNLIVDSLYSVGIGTTNPTSKLTVVGDVNVSGVVTTSQLSGYKSLFGSVGFTTHTFIVTVASKTSNHRYNGFGSANGYYIDGVESPFLTLLPGKTYRFDQSDASNAGHQLRFYLESNKTTEYLENVVFNGTAGSFGAYTQITITDTCPIVLHYQCTSHSLMGNSLQTNSNSIITSHNLNVSGISTLGITTVSSLSAQNLNVGVATATTVNATTFYGNLVGSITNATNLTGGYANASQLNVSGLATISQGRIQVDGTSNLRFGNLPAGSGSTRNIAIGDQVLVSLSGGSGRNIGIGELSYYDTTTGQYNIGIGERSGQKVSTGSYNVILGAYDGNSGNLDIRTSSNNIVIADGQGNIRQYINSSGNVGIKTTVVTEALTVAGIVSATSFYGTLNAGQLTGPLPAIDGSALIGVVATGSGVEIQEDGSPVGTAATINFGTNINVSFASGIATVSSASSVSFATTTYGLFGTPNLNVGVLTATSLNGPLAGNVTGNLTGNVTGNVTGTAGYATTAGISSAVSGTININTTGIITASSFSGSGSGLTNIPSGQLSGALPAIDGSALINLPAQPGDGINVRDDGSPVGSARTVDFGVGLDVTIVSGIATITASGGSLQSRTTVSGVTTSIANNGIGNTDITGFKSYALMKVGLSTSGWLRLYTDSTSRTNDASRSQGEDPASGSGVIAEVVTTGISTTQIITPFVIGGNLNNPADTTIYAAITNLSGTTQAITANLTILQLEA